tara:strand:+ start:51 stop:617 length:567 start_codon:yes stop_codon:yes gene_type:complete
MGQFGNQPDFATNDIKPITIINGFISDTPSSASFLNASVIYIGDNTGKELKVIPAGSVGPSVITGFTSPGFTGHGGTGYEDARANIDTIGGSGTGLTVNFTAVDGVVQTVAVNTAGTGYLNGDLITITPQGTDPGSDTATFRIVAAPGLPTVDQAVVFNGLGTGGFLPVTVDYVLATGTTVGKLIAAR